MRRWPLLVVAAVAAVLVWWGMRSINARPFPPDTTPEGAYLRIALALGEHRPRDIFAYVETEAQWASYTARDARRAACEKVRASYPPEEQKEPLATWGPLAAAPDGSDAFALLAARHGLIARVERDLSGVASVDVQGERATVVTGRGTRYPFRKRENGIWGMTLFTAELDAEAQRASRDLEVVERAARDYDGARAAER